MKSYASAFQAIQLIFDRRVCLRNTNLIIKALKIGCDFNANFANLLPMCILLQLNGNNKECLLTKSLNEFLFLIQAQLKTANKAGAIKMSTRCFAVLHLFDMYKGA